MNFKRLISLVFVMVSFFSGTGQKTEFLSQARLGYLMAAGQTDGNGADILIWKSYQMTYGFDFEIKYRKSIGSGLGIYLYHGSFSLLQDENKTIPDNVLHDKEVFVKNGAVCELFVNLYPTPKTNQGFFIRLSGFANYNYARDLRIRDIAVNGSSYEYVKYAYKKLDYVSVFDYGLKTALGYRHIAFSVKYRLSDYFTSDYKADFPLEFPRISVGVSIGSNFIYIND